MSLDHDEVDRYAKNSRFFKFDPRVKLASAILFISAVALLKDLTALYLALIFAIIMVELSGVPMRHIAEVYLLAFPFVLFAFITMLLTSGIENALAMAMRVSASVLALLLVISSTPFFGTLRALRWFKVPPVICNLVLFTYRFIFLLTDELSRMRMARRSRGFQGGRSLLDKGAFKTISYTIGMVFVRSNSRATRIYDALLSRGYTGEIRTIEDLKVGARDIALAAVFISITVILLAIQMGAFKWTL
ncbi:MAG: cobalt ECF transporter T component CbiQ [Methanomassiliicoccales archaeon]|nr:MAG: cobalt ECF transporter T component CbiQ [Methanomassiliicoccales archaeon]